VRAGLGAVRRPGKDSSMVAPGLFKFFFKQSDVALCESKSVPQWLEPSSMQTIRSTVVSPAPQMLAQFATGESS
jgi:hypothetical protein